MMFLILLSLVATVCANPFLFNVPYDGVSTFVPGARADLLPLAYLYNFPIDNPDYRSYFQPYYAASPAFIPAAANIAPASPPQVTSEGYLVDTPEVAAAKVAHFIQHVKALSRN